MKRIGLLGGMSWESTRTYYSLLNELTGQQLGAWHQPRVVIDSLDFSEIVAFQNRGDWNGSSAVLCDSARRLERAGATVLAITANTMHMNFEDVARSVTVEVLDIRDAIVDRMRLMGATSLVLLGTRYLVENDFYSAHLEASGIRVVKPTRTQTEDLQTMIFDELTRGIVTDRSRSRFLTIADDCVRRGGEVAGLCCTEFGMFLDDREAPWPFIDSTEAHVRALLEH